MQPFEPRALDSKKYYRHIEVLEATGGRQMTFCGSTEGYFEAASQILSLYWYYKRRELTDHHQILTREVICGT